MTVHRHGSEVEHAPADFLLPHTSCTEPLRLQQAPTRRPSSPATRKPGNWDRTHATLPSFSSGLNVHVEYASVPGSNKGTEVHGDRGAEVRWSD